VWRGEKRRCYLCAFARQYERDDLNTVLEFVSEPEFGEAFARSAGLCLPHLCAAVAVGRDHPNLQKLLAIHEERWQDLAWELDEFARKFDYRYSNEVRGQEGSSWHRALDLFVGRAAVFGPERGDAPDRPAPEGARPVPAAPGGPPAVEGATDLESRRFENKRLLRRTEELLAQREEDHRIRLALEFQILKLTANLKALEAAGPVAAPGSEPGTPAPPAVHDPDARPSPPGLEGS
jgi:hypothetical protein